MTTPMLTPRPWWLIWLPANAWMTLTPRIFFPAGIDPTLFPEIVAHEEVHIRQQADGLTWWVVRYLFSRSFRLQAEAEGYAAEIHYLSSHGAQQAANDATDNAVNELSGPGYCWAASSPMDALEAINEALANL